MNTFNNILSKPTPGTKVEELKKDAEIILRKPILTNWDLLTLDVIGGYIKKINHELPNRYINN